MTDTWELEITDGTARIRFAGDLITPLTLAHATELADVLGAVGASREAASVVVITGGDGRFIPDLDRDEIEPRIGDEQTEDDPRVWPRVGGDPQAWRRVIGDPQVWRRVMSVIESLPQPTIAAIDGEAAGAAALVAIACTFRLASERAVIGPVESNLGVVGTDSAMHLVPLVGSSVAMELLLTARRVPAPEAQQLGLVNDVLPADGFADHVREWCQHITSQPASSVFAAKRAVADQTSVRRIALLDAQPAGGPGPDQLLAALHRPCGCGGTG